MSNLQDRKSGIVKPNAFAARTEKALQSLEREKLKRERSGVLLAMAADGYGRSASGGWLGTLIKYIPIVGAAGFTVLASYAFVLAVT